MPLSRRQWPRSDHSLWPTRYYARPVPRSSRSSTPAVTVLGPGELKNKSLSSGKIQLRASFELFGSSCRKVKNRVIDRHIWFSLFDNDFLLVRIALAPGFDGKWNEYARYFFVIADIGFNFHLGSLLDPLGYDADLEEIIRIQVNKIYIAVLAHDFQFI